MSARMITRAEQVRAYSIKELFRFTRPKDVLIDETGCVWINVWSSWSGDKTSQMFNWNEISKEDKADLKRVGINFDPSEGYVCPRDENGRAVLPFDIR